MTHAFAEGEFNLPARPAVLAELTAALEAEDPDFRSVSALINKDLGLASAVVSAANSPYFGVSGRINSVQHAINFLGLSQVFSMVTGVMLRRVFPDHDPLVEAVWDLSAKRAALMARLARNAKVPPDRAYTAGLFQDCGVVLLAVLAPDYRQTWQRTRWLPDAAAIELLEHEIDHPTLSALLVGNWGLPDEIAQAVKFHHRIDDLAALDLPARSRSLIALSVLADFVLVRALTPDAALWEPAFNAASSLLDVPPMTSQTWVEQASSLLETSH